MIIMNNCCKSKFALGANIIQLSQQDKRLVQIFADAQINMSSLKWLRMFSQNFRMGVLWLFPIFFLKVLLKTFFK